MVGNERTSVLKKKCTQESRKNRRLWNYLQFQSLLTSIIQTLDWQLELICHTWCRSGMTTTAAGREQNQQCGKSPLQMWSISHHKPHHESPSDFKHWVEKSFKLCRSYFTAGIFKWSSSGVPFSTKKDDK